ncbi:MAG TPA: IS701 family transposase [Candidatus Obscuribacterales bacterium]
MKETTPSAMPPCFERWCSRFDEVLSNQAQRKGFRHYIGGLLGESERKNLTQMSNNTVGVVYHSLHHFLTEATWDAQKVNERRMQVMQQCSQTKIRRGFTLIIDDSGHRKSGNETAGVGRQYIGEIGKTDNGVVLVTTHLYDGVKSVPLDVELYQHASSLPEGKEDPKFIKKPDIALSLVDKCLSRGEKPGVVLVDAGYGNNTTFLKQLETKKLKYIAGLAKNRKVICQLESSTEKIVFRLDDLAIMLEPEAFTAIELEVEKTRTVWVATVEVEISALSGTRIVAIVMNAASLLEATEVDYLITNLIGEKATGEWIVKTYSQRNWVEVFYREAKGWLGLREYQTRSLKSLRRHLILVFCAYSFIIWQQLTGGIRRRWANKPLNTFTEALSAFRTAISYRFVGWLQENTDVFALHLSNLGLVWA